MRVVIDLRSDADGRPVGTVQVEGEPGAEQFADWLDLLRLIEACTQQIRPGKGSRS